MANLYIGTRPYIGHLFSPFQQICLADATLPEEQNCHSAIQPVSHMNCRANYKPLEDAVLIYIWTCHKGGNYYILLNPMSEAKLKSTDGLN